VTGPGVGSPRTALLTGAATGIGLATARLLSTDGWRVIGTALPGQDSTDLTALPGVRVLHVDLGDDASRTTLIRAFEAEPRLHALISNAGLAIPSPVEGMPVAQLRAQFEVNTVAPVHLVQAVLPRLRVTGGRMVFVGAGQGRVALPFGGPYGASKAALAALTDALRLEIADTGVTVSLIEPGAVRTGILADSRRRADAVLARLPEDLAARYRDRLLATLARSETAFATAMPAEEVARLILRILAAAKPKPRYLIGREAVGLAVVAALPARWRGALLARLARPTGSAPVPAIDRPVTVCRVWPEPPAGTGWYLRDRSGCLRGPSGGDWPAGPARR
jgi:NAD(P)-dependent dehydrogenase (short-subunit alcohol dehydrogenase family)